jgi:hypothetical protein
MIPNNDTAATVAKEDAENPATAGRTEPSGVVSVVRRILQVEALPVLIATLILAIVIGVLKPRFLSFANLHDVLQQSVYVAVLAAALPS